MEQPYVAEQEAPKSTAAAGVGYFLRSHRLAIARGIVFTLIALTLAIFLLTIPGRGLQVRAIAEELRRSLRTPALSTGFLDTYIIALDILTMCGSLALSLILLWRKPRDPLALFFALTFALFGVWITRPQDSLPYMSPPLISAIHCLDALGQALIIFFGALFPTGRFVPRWMRPLSIIWALLTLAWLVMPWLPLNTIYMNVGTPSALLPLLLLLIALGVAVYAQVYRYRRVSTLLQRQQTKWVVFGAICAIVGFAIFMAPPLFAAEFRTPTPQRIWYILAGVPVFYAFALLLPLSIVMSIGRYRLWDIDIIINRALVYAIITGLLALLYFGSVTSLQFVFRQLTGQNSTLAVVSSTLLLVVFFRPLHGRVQRLIDRRFYRQRYDAARTLAAFSSSLHQEANLEQVSEQLLKVVHETLQPTQVSLWLIKSEEKMPNAQLKDLE